jgi:putative membrane-bound dehydrogenase-like protein
MPSRLLAFSLCSLLFAASTAAGQGYSPDEAPRRMTVPKGLEVSLVAAEPLVRQPVAIEFDDRGRLWVVQYLQYPNPAGLKRAKVDRYSRTTYDQVPAPPPRGPKGADRVTILKDTDGDGRADGSKDFLSDLNLCSGIAFGHGGVFVLQVPYLLFYPDRDRDDRPDGDPEVLLSGFGMDDAHSVANSLTWGPDGWLYGCQGSTVTSNIRDIEFQQGVWRYHPLSKRFELFCEGGGNSWGLDFDDAGNLFYSTNYGGYAMLHGVQGGYYWKQFGKHGALHNPYAYGYFDHVPHANLHGGHVTVGGIIYQGHTLGEQFRSKYIAADLLGHAAYWHEITPRGSTFSARQVGDFLLANDTWFAPSDVTVGPDGAIYICDWHDARTGHPDPDADWDRTNGRIYRIAKRGTPPPSIPDFNSLSTPELIILTGDENDWIARKARRVLADRRDPTARETLLPIITNGTDWAAHLALEALWALYVSGGLDDPIAAELLDHPSADIRRWTVRFIGDQEKPAPELARRLAELAAREPSVHVRSQLASTAKRLPGEQALPLIERLLAHDEDHDDPFVPLLVWWAVEHHADSARENLLDLLTRQQVSARPLVRETVLPRLLRRYAAIATRDGYLACARLLAAAPQADRTSMLAALDQGLADRTTARGGSAGALFSNLAAVSRDADVPKAPPVEIPTELARLVDGQWRDNSTDLAVIRLSARLGRPAAQRRALELARDASRAANERADAVRLLGEVGSAASVEPLLELVSPDEPPTVQLAALDSIARFDRGRTAIDLLDRLPSLPIATHAKACEVLLGRKAWATVLLRAVDKGQVDAKEIPLDALRLVALHADPGLDAIVKQHWGSVQSGTPEERLAEMRRINNDLRAARGDPDSGKRLFVTHCGTCHRLFGEGNQVGPELTHANRKNLDELLATIVSPSAVIRKEFMSYQVHTVDGRVLTGLIAEQTPAAVTLLSAKNERTTIARDQIELLEESSVSLMPDNLLAPLKPQELRDLFSYLQSDATAEAASNASGSAEGAKAR